MEYISKKALVLFTGVPYRGGDPSGKDTWSEGSRPGNSSARQRQKYKEKDKDKDRIYLVGQVIVYLLP